MYNFMICLTLFSSAYYWNRKLLGKRPGVGHTLFDVGVLSGWVLVAHLMRWPWWGISIFAFVLAFWITFSVIECMLEDLP